MSTTPTLPRTGTEETSLARATERLRSLHAELDAAIAALGPVCLVSGRCCRFREYGHTLFVSGVEMAHLLEAAPPRARELDDGSTCPWQDDAGRCAAREARPLGCRVYFCDPTHEGRGEELSARFLSRLKALADELDLPWDYRPLHQHLRTAESEGRLPPRASPPSQGPRAAGK